VVSYVCIGFHHGRKTLHQLIRHNIRVHMQPSDALCLLFDCYSVHSSVISTRMPIFFWVHFLTSVMCSIFFQLCTISALAILTSRHSLSLTILIFPCTNTIPWHCIICSFGIEPNFQLCLLSYFLSFVLAWNNSTFFSYHLSFFSRI